MQNHPVLPPLKQDPDTANFQEIGVWENRDPVQLETLSTDLKDTSPDADYVDVNSIPDMWARPLLFEMALYDNSHPAHKRILGEWRGLLAVLALKERRSFPLTTQLVQIPDVNNTNASEFLHTLRKLIPKHTLDADTTWERLHLILLDNNPIGLTSPTTLVCTSAEHFKGIRGVPWFEKGFFSNPIRKLSQEEQLAVGSWLHELHTGYINPLPNLDRNLNEGFQKRIRSITNTLKRLIREFRNDLGHTLEISAPLSKTGIGLTEGFFLGMDKPLEAVIMDSNVELVPSRDEPPKTTLLVVDEAIASDWEVEPKDVAVWESSTLETYKSFGGKLESELPNEVHLRTPKDFFTDKLFVINQENAFHEEGTLHPQGSTGLKFQKETVTPILPITMELLTYLQVNDLSERITFIQQNQQNSSDITVSLSLPLSGINGQQEFTISKVYSAQDIESIDNLPVLAIWPNFKTSDWQAYYTYFDTPQPTFYAKPILPPGSKISDFRPYHDKQYNVEKEITKTECFPEAVLCEYNGIKAGILLLSVPETRNAQGITWTVGVDFGTSSTTIYKNDSESDPQRMEFADRLFQVTNHGELNRLSDNFLPDRSQLTPFFSLFEKFQNSNPQEPMLDGRIYFVNEHEDFSKKTNIISNLKWSPNPVDLFHVQVFLKQLCLQSAAEAVVQGVQEINWQFSYPLAFSERNKRQFENIWKQVITDCVTATGLPQKIVFPAQSESVVTAKFFASTPQNKHATGGFTTGAVCIDIGGETSDISIWQGNKLYWQASLRFAGRHIFSNLLRKKPEFLKNLGAADTDIDFLEKAREGTLHNFYAQADALLQKRGKEWLELLSTTHMDTPEIHQFAQLIATGAAGLLYYVGLVLKHLAHSESFKEAFAPKMPSVYIGGNGSNILHWIADGNFGPNSACSKHLKQILSDAAGFDQNNIYDFEISRLPKQEAAYGLVADKMDLSTAEKTDLGSDKPQFDILAGETFIEDDKDYSWTEILTPERLVKGLQTKQELEQLGNFVESFNKQAGVGQAIEIPIELDKGTNQFIYQQLQNRLSHFKGAEIQNLHIEPLFILASKLLLERKTAEW